MALVTARVLYRIGRSPHASYAIDGFGNAVNGLYRKGVNLRARMIGDRSLKAVFSEPDLKKREILLKQAVPDVWATGLSRALSTILVSKNSDEVLKALATIARFDTKRIVKAVNRYLARTEVHKTDDKQNPLNAWEESYIIHIAARHVAKAGEYQKAMEVACTIDNLYFRVFSIIDIAFVMYDALRVGRPMIERHELDSLLREATKIAERIPNRYFRKIALDAVEDKRIYFGLES